ncbi:MAG: hypothetical protein QXD59_06220 [Candidatus Caldarchaeum sp.]
MKQNLAQSFAPVIAAADNPVAVMGAIIGGRLLPSGSDDQRRLNAAVAAHLAEALRRAREVEDAGEALRLYVEAEGAVRALNTQRTRHLPDEVVEARRLFVELCAELHRWRRSFPEAVRPRLGGAWRTLRYEEIKKAIATPHGVAVVGVKKAAGERVWYPFARVRGTETQSPHYIRMGVVSPNRLHLDVQPMYESDRFWGLEVVCTTSRGLRFAWEIKIEPPTQTVFSLAREWKPGEAYPVLGDPRLGDALLRPGDGEFALVGAKPLGGPPEIAGRTVFDPPPIGWWHAGGVEEIAEFAQGVAEVVISHPDHPSVRVKMDHGWSRPTVAFRSVGGRTHYEPPSRRAGGWD